MRIKNLPSILSMDGSQDALVIEQTDGSEDKSRKVSPAQIKQYVLGNSIDDIYSVMGQNGAKNLIPYPYYDPSGRTNRGITFTYDKDGIITANGSTNANDQAYMTLTDFSRGLVLSSNKKYTLTCEKTNDNNKGFAVLYFKNADNTAKTVSTHVVYEDGTTQNVNRDYVSLLYNNVAHTSATFWVDTDTIYITQARIHTNSGTITNAVLKPMLRLAEDTDNTYQPYAKTNKQLTEVIGDLSETGLTGDSVAEQLDTARGQIADINTALLPIDAVVKRFSLGANRTIDTGINVNNTYSMGFIAIVSSHSSNNSGRMNIYMGGVAYRKQGGTVGDINYSRLGGVGLGSGTAGDNLSFSISNDKLQITAPQYQDALSVTLILSKR